jgi:glycosyltransferase involved in cell wall biosynthesis
MLVDPTDTCELIQAMLHMSCDEPLRHELIERGREQAARYSWERAARELLAVFDRSTGAKHPPIR